MKSKSLLILLVSILVFVLTGCALDTTLGQVYLSRNGANKLPTYDTSPTATEEVVTVGQMANYLQTRAEHYPLSDEFIEKYQQKDGGYIELAESLGMLVDRQQHSPNQKWHFFESWLYPSLEAGTISLTESAKSRIYTGLLCPELLLWIYEACGVSPVKVKSAMEVAMSAKTDGTHISTMAKNMRACVPWEDVSACLQNKVSATDITLSANNLNLEVGGADGQITANISPLDATEFASWTVVEGQDCVSISASGNTVTVKALKEGSAKIKATCNADVWAECVVTVVDNTPTTIVGLPTNLKLKIGQTHTLEPTLSKGQGTFTYLSQSTDVATVSADGVVTAVASGSTTITVTCVEIPTLTQTIDVVVAYPAENLAEPSSYTISYDLGTRVTAKQIETNQEALATLILASNGSGVVDSISKISYFYGGGSGGRGETAWHSGNMIKIGTTSYVGSVTFELNAVVNYVKITGYVHNASCKVRVGDSSSTIWVGGADDGKTTMLSCKDVMTVASKETISAGSASTITISFEGTTSVTISTDNKYPLYITAIEFGYAETDAE